MITMYIPLMQHLMQPSCTAGLSLLHSLVQIRVEFLGVKPWSTEHIKGLLELNGFPPVT